jgi:hypothetical protein
MSLANAPIRSWLKGQREFNELHLEMMTLWYDLDGARSTGQTGVAWWAQQRLLVAAVRLLLREAGVALALAREELERAFLALEALRRVNPALSDEVWDLWLRPLPAQEELAHETDRTLRFIGNKLDAPWAVTRQGTVARWADSTRALRTVAQRLGIAQANSWYLSASSDPGADWYQEVLAVLADERGD